MSVLPDAEAQCPACGCCGAETAPYGEYFACEDCDLSFDAETLTASFLNPEAEPCGVPCDNFWHGDHKIKQGTGYDCGACKLPAGHTSMHWTGCEPRLCA